MSCRGVVDFPRFNTCHICLSLLYKTSFFRRKPIEMEMYTTVVESSKLGENIKGDLTTRSFILWLIRGALVLLLLWNFKLFRLKASLLVLYRFRLPICSTYLPSHRFTRYPARHTASDAEIFIVRMSAFFGGSVVREYCQGSDYP